MPRRKRLSKQSAVDAAIFAFIALLFDAIVSLFFEAFFGGYLVVKAIVTKRPIEKHSLKQQRAFKRAFTGVVRVGGMVLVFCLIFPELRAFFVFLAVIILIPLIIILWRKRQKRIAITSEIDKHLRIALEMMDSTSRWYNNEEEANRELVTCLKA